MQYLKFVNYCSLQLIDVGKRKKLINFFLILISVGLHILFFISYYISIKLFIDFKFKNKEKLIKTHIK